MPIYEFYCPDNHRIYSFLARSLAYSAAIPRCPDNPRFQLRKSISSFAFIGKATEKPDLPGGADDLDDPRMMALMAEMEKEISGLDEENPDPRAMARMMRKMGELGGQPMPAAVEEMIARMEKGEDPEKLEEEYGDAVEGFDPMGEGEGGEPGGKSGPRFRLGRPRRDPKLYEMTEYLGPGWGGTQAETRRPRRREGGGGVD